MATTRQRKKRRRTRLPNYRLVRYADDFVVMVHGTRADAEALRGDIAAVLAPLGFASRRTKTTIAHIDEGFDFLGWRIQRHRKRGTANTTSTPTRPRPPSARHGQGEGAHPART